MAECRMNGRGVSGINATTVMLCIQSPGGGSAFHNSAFENPNLLDNWDDAEGYYSKCFQDSS